MFRGLKLCFLFVVLFSLASCEEQEELNPRRRTVPGTETLRVFRGSFNADGSSAPPCPNGFPAEVRIDFSQSTLDVLIPTTDMANVESPELAAANQIKVPAGEPTTNSTSGDFMATFSVADTAEDFDANGCSDAGDTYAQEIRLVIEGSVTSGAIQGATYEILNVCTGGSVAPAACSGTFSGNEVAP